MAHRALGIISLALLGACSNTESALDSPDTHIHAQAVLGTPAPLPVSTQFDITGHLQQAIDGGAAAPGTLRVNGQIITVPVHAVVILPANALTWHELFAQAPAPYGPAQSGLALADYPAPITSYEVHVIGNRVTTAAGGDQYIAGLIDIAQHSLMTGSGYVNYIDYANAELRVGGALGNPSSGTRVRINDPAVSGSGRFSKGLSPDRRFTADPDNPTIISGTGFPMCLPRAAPVENGEESDPLCPQGNRPLDLAGTFVSNFQMPDPATLAAGQLPDARIQAPLEVGDFITYAGLVVTDRADATVGPWPSDPSETYVSAHEIVNNTAIYTAPGTDPAYVTIDVTLAGVGGNNVAGGAEAGTRTRFEGMTTDPSRGIHLYGIDLDSQTGESSERSWGTIGVDPGPPNGGVKGRWRFRPPCVVFGTVPADPVKDCVMNAESTFLPPTREVRAVIEGQQGQLPGAPGALTAANGINYGQYHAPISEYILPENVPGSPIVANNLEALPFLACGGFTTSGGTLVGQLSPWPGATAPICPGQVLPPVASAGPDQVAASGATVALAGSSTGTAPFNYAWTQTAGPAVVLTDATSATPQFTAPIVAVATPLTFELAVTNTAGTSTDSVVITISASTAPTVNPIAPRSVGSGTPVAMTATCSDPGGLSCTFVWQQTAGAPIVLSPNPRAGATINFTVALAQGAAPTTLSFSIVATNSAGQSSFAATTSVTVTPPPDAVNITAAEYRTQKQRLTVTATSSLVSPTVVLTLQPYVTITGTTFDPAGLGATLTNNGNGTYEIELDGAPEPAVPPATPLTVRSSAGGVSPPRGLTRIRQ